MYSNLVSLDDSRRIALDLAWFEKYSNFLSRVVTIEKTWVKYNSFLEKKSNNNNLPPKKKKRTHFNPIKFVLIFIMVILF